LTSSDYGINKHHYPKDYNSIPNNFLNFERDTIYCDILFYQSHMSVFMQKSKTDIYRDGDRIVIARTDNKLCPVQNLENYLEWSCNPSDSDVYLFRNLIKSKDNLLSVLAITILSPSL
jgi:hypothetical protein